MLRRVGVRADARLGQVPVQVTAFNTPQDPSWRWRIVNYAGEVIAESEEGFASIHAALAPGTEHLP